MTEFIKRVDAQITVKERETIALQRECNDSYTIELERGSELHLVEVVTSGVKSSITIKQQSDTRSYITIIQIGDGTIDYTVCLDGHGAECDCNILQLVTEREQAMASLRIEHNVANCNSRSQSKCVAAGESAGIFKGLVYVAQDAQHTESSQSSRNIALTRQAKIVAEPMLEIYADDVKCSHGATVGQMNQDAILYMCQRGLSAEQARKLQLEGFVGDIAEQCTIEDVKTKLFELIEDKLHRL